MIGRIFLRNLLFACPYRPDCALVRSVRSQKRAISEVVHISAWVLLAAAMLALGWYVWAAW